MMSSPHPFFFIFNEFSRLVRHIMKMNGLDRVCLDFDKACNETSHVP